jgi:hypothetical protein
LRHVGARDRQARATLLVDRRLAHHVGQHEERRALRELAIRTLGALRLDVDAAAPALPILGEFRRRGIGLHHDRLHVHRSLLDG